MTHPPSPGHRLAAHIERLRGEGGWTYRELADEAGIPLTTLHRRLKGDGFTLSELARLADAFNVTPSALMAGAEREDVAS